MNTETQSSQYDGPIDHQIRQYFPGCTYQKKKIQPLVTENRKLREMANKIDQNNYKNAKFLRQTN
jgi:hypothetical protein